MSKNFPHLFEPFQLGPLALKNRVFVPGHGTSMCYGCKATDQLIAYHERRAKGGVGLIVTEVQMVHESAIFTDVMMTVVDDSCIAPLAQLADAVHRHDCALIGQLFHPGRVMRSSVDGSICVALAPSEVPDHSFHISPRPLPVALIWEIVEAFASGGRRMIQAGFDGVELIGSHGYLISQFLNPRLNRRNDNFGGDFERRLRFLREVLDACRKSIGPDKVLGLRISGDEMDEEGLRPDEVLAVCKALDAEGVLDYVNIIAGTMGSPSGMVHVIPPSPIATSYVAPIAAPIKAALDMPVLVAGRINTAQEAERILAQGQADMCGLVRAHICDPDFVSKAKAGRAEDIRACIGCDQACIGHMMAFHPISCIQRPESGREREFDVKPPAEKPGSVWVVGGGPGGMKAATVAAERGHDVTLFEKTGRLGGQALLAQMLPDREEFGGLVTNFVREVESQDVTVKLGTEVTPEMIGEAAPDAVILATGGVPRSPEMELDDEAHVVDAWSVIKDEANIGHRVVIADGRCDWIGMGVAAKLAQAGCAVRLAVGGVTPGEILPLMVRDHWLGTLHRLGVEIVANVRIAGADGDSVYFSHRASGEPVICEEVDTLVLAQGNRRVADLEDALADYPGPVIPVGDCLAPRSCEEAILEGLKAGMAL